MLPKIFSTRAVVPSGECRFPAFRLRDRDSENWVSRPRLRSRELNSHTTARMHTELDKHVLQSVAWNLLLDSQWRSKSDPPATFSLSSAGVGLHQWGVKKPSTPQANRTLAASNVWEWDANYCDRRSLTLACLSVCPSRGFLRCPNTAKRIEVLFGMNTSGGPKEHKDARFPDGEGRESGGNFVRCALSGEGIWCGRRHITLATNSAKNRGFLQLIYFVTYNVIFAARRSALARHLLW